MIADEEPRPATPGELARIRLDVAHRTSTKYIAASPRRDDPRCTCGWSRTCLSDTGHAEGWRQQHIADVRAARRLAKQADGRCAGCRAPGPELSASDLCVGCDDAALEVIVTALQDAEVPPTRAELTAAVAAAWPQVADPAALAGHHLDDLISEEEVKEISPGRYRLVADAPPSR